MFQDKAVKKDAPKKRNKWAKAAGDHETVSALGTRGAGKYISDLDYETSESIRFKPAADKASRVKSVRPSCCASQEELPKLAGQVQLTTGKAEVGYDEKKKDMVFGFVRHENDSQGREVQENKARIRTIHGRDRFRSNDEEFSEGAMSMRCEAARNQKAVMRRFGKMSELEDGDSTMDRVLPFQRVDKEEQKLRQLRQMEHQSDSDRSNIHSAASGVAAFAARKEQKQLEFKKKFSKAMGEAQKQLHSDDYQLYIRKKWEAILEHHLLENPSDGIGFGDIELEDIKTGDLAPEGTAH